jgi:hypothetical protein
MLAGGIALLFWSIFFPQSVVAFDLKSVEVWAVSLGLAYVGGHVCQGVGNEVSRLSTPPEEAAFAGVLSPAIIAACKKKAKELTGVDAGALSPRWLYRLCDDAVIRSGKIGEREVFVYREGFYRGSFIGMAILVSGVLGLFVRLLLEADNGAGRWGNAAKLGDLEFTPARLVFLAATGTVTSALLWRRYQRFAEYRVTHAMLGFLTIQDDKKPTTEKGPR